MTKQERKKEQKERKEKATTELPKLEQQPAASKLGKKKKKKKRNKKNNNQKKEGSMVKINKSKTVMVNGMPHGVKLHGVRKFFKPCGGIQYIDILKFQDSGKSRGMCTITFKRATGAQKAIGLTGKWWGKRYVEVKPYMGLGESYTPPDVDNLDPECFTIFVGNLDYSVTEDDLRGAFEGCGAIKEIRCATDAQGTARGFAHITFVSQDGVRASVKLAGDLLKGRPVRVEFDSGRSMGENEGVYL